MSFNHLASNCMKSLHQTMTPAKVISKYGCDINKSIFLDKAFQNYSFSWKKDLVDFFWLFLFNKQRFEEKSPALKNSWLGTCSWFLWNMFKSLVISFVYLTNNLTNICTKLYTFCISPVQSQHNNIKTTFYEAMF